MLRLESIDILGWSVCMPVLFAEELNIVFMILDMICTWEKLRNTIYVPRTFLDKAALMMGRQDDKRTVNVLLWNRCRNTNDSWKIVPRHQRGRRKRKDFKVFSTQI